MTTLSPQEIRNNAASPFVWVAGPTGDAEIAAALAPIVAGLKVRAEAAHPELAKLSYDPRSADSKAAVLDNDDTLAAENAGWLQVWMSAIEFAAASPDTTVMYGLRLFSGLLDVLARGRVSGVGPALSTDDVIALRQWIIATAAEGGLVIQ